MSGGESARVRVCVSECVSVGERVRVSVLVCVLNFLMSVSVYPCV